MRTGPLAELGLIPQDAYYGSQTTAALFVVALAELWHWTGDDDLLREHLDTARGALTWARDRGDLDGDGFLEYERRSPRGLPNQAWKDSDEAIRHADGRSAHGPIATVEEQAYHILAIERMAEILTALGDDEAADAELRRAGDLRRRWHDAFWMPDASFYAMALDGDKRQVRPIASNAGHALAAGVVPRRFAAAVAGRLMARDLFSGWGIRTLSSDDASYNPFAYHLGAVWPVEQTPIALGLKRYGFDGHVDRLVDGVLRAAELSPGRRLPEALTGHDRGDVPAPVPYPRANSPQAWSASAVIGLVQTMLGLEPFAPLRLLRVVRPRLPAWLPEVTLRGLRVGHAVADIRFRRRADGSAAWQVVGLRGPLLVVPAAPSHGGGAPSPLERVGAAALDHAPGRLGGAARIAFRRE
jgi:glycogen debranching enzyme